MKAADSIILQKVSTGYSLRKREKKIITRDIDATLRSGELTCLLGPNGAGKSTLLRTLSGFIPPLDGTIYLDNESIQDYSSYALAKKISIVLTDKLSVPDMSLVQLVGLGRSPYTNFWGQLSEEDKQIVQNVIDIVGVSHLAERMVSTLSDGERQKALIAKALAQQTPVIFLDEPTAFLDYPSKVEIMILLLRLARDEKKTIFLSTHDLDLALQIADIVWLIDRKHGVVTGTPEDLSLSGDLEKYFRSSGIEFDANSGMFRIHRDYNSNITISGSGVRKDMLVKALERIGIKAVTVEDSADIIVYEDRGYLYKNMISPNIDSLLKRII